MARHKGGCHCGRIAFEVEAPAHIRASQCNCSVCRMVAYLHLIVPARDFKLLRGEDELSTYTFNTGIARHYFCRHCGVKSFYVPRSHPQGISVNVNCLDPATILSIEVRPFDGAHWEQNIARLSPLSD